MRLAVVVLALVAACEWRVVTSHPHPDACPSYGCTTCPFFEGSGAVACTNIGSGCQIETWEHGCACSCVSPGWWSCSPETIGSTCPSPPPPDAGVWIDDAPNDAR